MRSSLKARLASRVRIRDVSPHGSGSSAAYVLASNPEFTQTVAAARILIRGGIAPSRARSLVERLLAREQIAIVVPTIASISEWEKSLAALGLSAKRREIPQHVNVAEIRHRLSLTQEEFAVRFGLNIATVRNWEQGRSEPDEPARGFLAVIARHPEVAEAAVSA